MERFAPKPAMLESRMRIGHTPPEKLTDRVTPLGAVLELSSMGVPDISPSDWKLEIAGLVDRMTSISFEELKLRPKRTVESVFVCSGDPRRPKLPLRRVANVKWGGADLADLLAVAGIQPEATHLWSYGLDHGEFMGFPQHHYVKDMPLWRLKQGNVLIAYEMNNEPLTNKNGFPARLVVPGFYGTNSVKWLCRLELRETRATDFMTTRLYNDPDFERDPSGEATKPVWAVAPESIIVAPKPESAIARNPTEIWGWTWSDCAIRSVEISTDGGDNWVDASLEAPNGLSWQRFSLVWQPSGLGTFELRSRAIDVRGRVQPAGAARNAVYAMSVDVQD
jgi:DMSO/TMAO reductase YedYZ molybdopterin-dependent catalytic subunit